MKLSGIPISKLSSPRTIDFVGLGAAADVVGLHCQHFLERVGGAIGFERPHFHFAEALSAELGLAAQRLLRDQAVRSDRARMDLVVDQMVELQHIDVAHRHIAVEELAGSSVDQADLTGGGQSGHRQQTVDVRLVGPVEHRRRHRHAGPQIAGHFEELRARKRLDFFGLVSSP